MVAASDYKSLGKLKYVVKGPHFYRLQLCNYLAAVYDINKFTMRETDEYDLKFVRYLLSAHSQNISCLTSISGKG